MKLFFLVMAFTLSASLLLAQDHPGRSPQAEIPCLIIANPTIQNIETLLFLVHHRILKMNPSEVRFLGVYHRQQGYDFQKSRDFIEAHAPGMFELLEVDGLLSLDDVFRENSCSESFRDIFRRSAGVLFFGGPDIQPEIYGEENLFSEVTDPARLLFEVSLAFHLIGGSRNQGFRPFLEDNPCYLVTGFCLGLQTMNVATGGTLVQDIPAQIYGKQGTVETLDTDRDNLHRNYWQKIHDDKQLTGINLHTIRFTDHPFFGKTMRVSKKASPRVYSSHHQSPGEIGTGFDITALSPDGKVVEAIAHTRYPHVFAVQFHPEVPALYEDREMWKFSPEDIPATYHRTIGRESVKFHKKYWKHISACLERSLKNITKP